MRFQTLKDSEDAGFLNWLQILVYARKMLII